MVCDERTVAVYVTCAHRAFDITPPQSIIRAIRISRSIYLLLINQNGTYMLSSELQSESLVSNRDKSIAV